MKIDLSSIFLVVIVLIPGLFAQRSRDLLVPRALGPKGASEELAEFVALGLATHGILIFSIAMFTVLAGVFTGRGLQYYFLAVDRWSPTIWASSHISESVLFATGYVFLSFFVSHCLGLIYGAFSLQGRLTAHIFKRVAWLQRIGIRGLLGERPIIYELLRTEIGENGSPKTLFVQAELKNGLGFYSGQLSKFAIVRDEEPHRPIYLIEAWYRKDVSQDYAAVQADGVLLDLADVVTLWIRRVDTSQETVSANLAIMLS